MLALNAGRPVPVERLIIGLWGDDAPARGRSTNEVFVATTGEQTAVDVVAQSIATDWIDRPALARQAETNPHTRPMRRSATADGSSRAGAMDPSNPHRPPALARTETTAASPAVFSTTGKAASPKGR